ncbi:MAG TPA: DUF6529 family protein [Acidimicrobiales bacterium]|nr:DUF6529 family protein [Acidimicrobiales bacterium]
MDVIKFLNDVTGGNLLLWKVVAAAMVFASAGLQVALAARLWGKGGPIPLTPAAAATAHRWNGRVALTLAVVVAFTCLAGPAGPLSPTRVLLHSIFGALVFAALTAKFALLKLTSKGQKALPYVGVSLFILFAAIWATSVADYVAAR